MDFDRNLVLERRTRLVANKVWEYLKTIDPMAKTILFCDDQDHAERVRQELAKIIPAAARNRRYVVRITGDDNEGKAQLSYFIDNDEPYPVIATTATLNMEGHLLVDPLSDEAWFVSFDRNNDGDCIAGPCPGLGTLDLERVTATIEILGLNRLSSLNKNRADVWDNCVARIQDYNNAAKEPLMHIRAALRLIAAKALTELCSEESEFSSVAKTCVEKVAPSSLRRHVNELLQFPVALKVAV